MENINIKLSVKDAEDLKNFLAKHRSIVAKESNSKTAIDAYLKAYEEAKTDIPA